MSRGARLSYAVLALAGVVAFAALGSWQLQRGLYKRDRLQQQEQAMAEAAPRALNEELRSADGDAPVRQVLGHGRYRAPLLLLDNQQRAGRVGVRAYAVAEVEGATQPLLVELGWIPWSPQRTLPALSLPDGERELSGLLVTWPGAGLALAPNPWPQQAQPTVLLHRLARDDVQRALALELAPRVLKLSPELDYGFERDLELLPNTLPPERHYGYALQWYALAATVLVLYSILALRARRKAKP